MRSTLALQSIGLSLPTYRPPDMELLTKRMLAFLFDWLIGVRIFSILFLALTGQDDIHHQTTPIAWQFHREIHLFIYFALSWASPWRATPGMLVFGLQVIDEDTRQRISIWQATVRHFFFSLWLCYYTRRSTWMQIQVEMGWATPEEMAYYVQQYGYLAIVTKFGLLAIMFVIPYIIWHRTFPDYISCVKMSFKRDNASAA